MIAKVVKKVNFGENDYQYWKSKPPKERMEALEEIRHEYHLWRYGYEPGFQRVLRIVEREQG